MTGIDSIYESFFTVENIALREDVMEEFVLFVPKLIKEGSLQ